jgi:asparagine synthase (glutamine-hydrolysing)
MDSSVVTALMAEASAEPVRTFSIGFEDRSYDELPYARAVANHFGTIHTEEVVRLDAIELLPELADHFDEPFGDSSAVPTFRVSQMASRSLKVVLTGDGGDESFGGYARYRAQRMFNAMGAVPGPLLRTATRIGGIATRPLGDRWHLHRRMRTAEVIFGMKADERYLYLMSVFDRELRARLLGTATSSTGSYLLDVLEGGSRNTIDRMLRADLLTYLPEDLLVKTDRATMANSLEARAPLLDHLLIEFAARLPVDRKISGTTTKVLLRAVAKRLMPAELVDRPKMGFGVPVGDWFRGKLGDEFRQLVLSPDAASRDHIDQTVAADLLAEHVAGQAAHAHRLWTLLMFELWARRWLRGSAEPLVASGSAEPLVAAQEAGVPCKRSSPAAPASSATISSGACSIAPMRSPSSMTYRPGLPGAWSRIRARSRWSREAFSIALRSTRR